MSAFPPRYVARIYGICTLVALCVLLMIFAERYIPRKIQPDAPLTENNAISHHFDAQGLGRYRTRIEGWVFKNGESVRTYDLKLLFRAADGTYYTLPSQIVRRPDVTAHFKDGNNYDASGFQIAGLSPALFARGPFTLYFLYRNDGKNLLIDTGVVL